MVPKRAASEQQLADICTKSLGKKLVLLTSEIISKLEQVNAVTRLKRFKPRKEVFDVTPPRLPFFFLKICNLNPRHVDLESLKFPLS